MSYTFLKSAPYIKILILITMHSLSVQARRYVGDTIPRQQKTRSVKDSIPETTFEPSVANGKNVAVGSLVFGVIAAFLNATSAVSKSVGPAGFAFASSLMALIWAGIAAIRSRKRGNRIPFDSSKEYKVVRKKTISGAILGVFGLVISIICMLVFFTFTMSL